ncbi:LuxR C-terminal-related transcriptional regulator [Marinicella sp. W31]|uniref:response regulator transcription factor n=1 Tax=Marinicella sp. W31 TaxID=3023713 RepID=UPI0037577432
MEPSISVIAADDHRLFLEGLKSLFSTSRGITLQGVYDDGDQALTAIQSLKPQVALLDLSMPGASVESIIKTVDEANISTELLVLTMHLEPQIAMHLISLGLSGYVLKEQAFDELKHAIKALACGEQFISPLLRESIRSHHSKRASHKDLLTQREFEVLQAVANGLSNKEIARQLSISERTVRFHLSNCFIKLDVNSRSKAINRAVQLSIIELHSTAV